MSAKSNEPSVTFDGIFLWGNNEFGVVDPFDNETKIIGRPRKLSFPLKLNQLALTIKVAAAIDEYGDLYQWGTWAGKIHRPVCVLKGRRLKKIAGNDNTILGLCSNGKQIVVLKLNELPQIEEKQIVPWNWNFWEKFENAPHLVIDVKPILLKGEIIKDIDMGFHHVTVLSSKGRVLTAPLSKYGNYFGQLGNSVLEPRSDDIVTFPDVRPFDRPNQDRLNLGELQDFLPMHIKFPGYNPEKRYELPNIIPDLPCTLNNLDFNQIVTDERNINFSNISCGSFHNLALTNDGRVFGFGSNHFHQLGLAKDESEIIVTPTEITSNEWKPNFKISSISANFSNSFFVLSSNSETELYGCGLGISGQIGNGSWIHAQNTPAKLKKLSNLNQFNERIKRLDSIGIERVSAGMSHVACELKTGKCKSLYLWGSNRFSELGNGKIANSNVPITLESFMSKDILDNSTSSYPWHLKSEQHIVCGVQTTAIYE